MTLLEEYLNDWVAPDGGGMIDPNDRLPPFPGALLDTTKNENPILFFVQTALEFGSDCMSNMFPAFKNHMEGTQIVPGLHSRRPGDAKQFRQSHDNIVGMVIGAWFFKTHHAEAVFQYGSRNGWIFDVANPGSTNDLRCQIQGGDVALCHYACGRTPSLWDAVWLGVGLAISTTWNLADIRIKFLEATWDNYPSLQKLVLWVSVSIHKWRRGPRIKWVQGYFKEQQYPFRKLVELESGQRSG